MENILIFNYFNSLQKDSLSLLYHGLFHDEFTDKIISISEENIEKSNESNSIRNKVSFLIAEAFQNVVRHKIKRADKQVLIDKLGMFSLRITYNTYYIASANLIENKNIETISSKISEINKTEKEKLKELYLNIINNNELSEKGGAGVGLIQIASKSGNKIEFDFERIDDKFSVFYLQIKLISKNAPDITNNVLDINSVKKNFNELNQSNTQIVYKGDFNQDNIVALLEIFEKNLQADVLQKKDSRYVLFYILTELLQNITQHGYSASNIKDGIVTIGKMNNIYTISTGNYILNSKIEYLTNYIDLLNIASKEELHQMYIEKLKSGITNENENAGTGLIEIAKESSDKIKYTINNINENYSFLTISVFI